MKRVQHAYINTPHVRVISASDFKSLGVEDQLKAEWSPENRHVVEISDEAAAKLLEVEPGEWRVLDDDASTSDGEAFEPLGSGEDDDETAGTGTASRTTRRRSTSS